MGKESGGGRGGGNESAAAVNAIGTGTGTGTGALSGPSTIYVSMDSWSGHGACVGCGPFRPSYRRRRRSLGNGHETCAEHGPNEEVRIHHIGCC